MLTLFLFEESIIGIGIWLVSQLFKVAAFAFKIFMILAQSDAIKEIHYDLLLTNFYVVLGIIMLFVMAFALLRGIVNPDDQKQGTTAVKNIIVNFVISCVMLGFLPTIFSFMFDVQDSILRYNVIGGFFGYGSLGDNIVITNNVNEVESSAYRLVNGVFTAFFNVSDGYCQTVLGNNTFEETDDTSNSKKSELVACQKSMIADRELKDVESSDNSSFFTYKNYVDQTGQFSIYSAFKEQAADDNISFNFIVLLIAGIALLYVGVSYCFDMGLRLIKLIFYQILAPIPIFLRVVPNSKFSGTFNQWLKVTLTCWTEVFVRIFIFCFCTWLCSAIMDTNFLSSGVYEYGRTTGLFTQAFILMAIVMFMKRSPKLLSEITGIDSGNMKLGIREKLAEGGGFVAGAAIGAGASTLAKNASASIQNYRNKFERDENGNVVIKNGKKMLKNGKAATFGTRFWGAVGGVASVAAGTASGFVKGGKAAKGAKNEKDMKNAVTTSTQEAVGSRVKRSSYRAARSTGQGGVVGWIKDTGKVIAGHAKDAFKTGYNFVTDQSIEGLTRESQSMEQIISSYNTFREGTESLLEKEQSKGGGSVFIGHGFEANDDFTRAYKAFDEAAQRKREIMTKFQTGQTHLLPQYDDKGMVRKKDGKIIMEERKVTERDLRDVEKEYSDARDAASDEFMDIAFAGENSGTYKGLDVKGQAAMQTGIVNAEKFQTTLVANAGSQAVQTVMGASGNGSLGKILSKDKHLEVADLEYEVDGKTYKLKDVTNVFKGQVDNKIAEMHKEEAAKGEKK